MTALILQLCFLWISATTDVSSAQKTFIQGTGLISECIGNVLKVAVDGSLVYGHHFEVDAINGSTAVPLTHDLAAKCGYSWDSDPWGNTKIYASLLSCFTYSQDDVLFDIGLRLRLYGGAETVQDVRRTCEYRQWVSREILCERNFMEVSVHKLSPVVDVYKELTKDHHANAFSDVEETTTLNTIWRMVFYTPKEKPMTLEEVQNAGYGVSTSPTRFVMRSPYHMPDLYSEKVNGVEMEVFKVTTYFRWAWTVTLINTAAVCPTGGLHFTDEVITWYVPRYITPLIMHDDYELLELYMGVDGKRLNPEQMNTKGYVFTLTDSQIIISLPMGGPDGYYKSYALGYEYHITYCIEPMLELLWREGSEITSYKVHYPISTPPEPRPPHAIDNTVPASQMFEIILGTFLNDVALMNLTFSTGVMSVHKAIERGINIQQYRFPNGSKTFSIQVPFSDPVVLKSHIKQIMVYTLPVTFGLIILPEYTPFPHTVQVEAIGEEIIMPDVNGICDKNYFYVTIDYGSRGKNFKIMVGKRDLSADVYTEYMVEESATHLSMTVPFLARDVAFEFVGPSSVRARIDILLHDDVGNWQMKNFSMACTFPMTMIECFPNGSMTALAVKVESSTIVPSELTLRDPYCKPTFSDNRFAYFSFNASGCGTTRTFEDSSVTYWNEISMGGVGFTYGNAAETTNSQHNYSLSISCSYSLNDLKMLAFSAMPHEAEIVAEPGFGELHVRMRLARDSSYRDFFMEQDYPVVQYLRRPLYFEVQLVQSTDPRIELVLDKCWASDAGSTVSWDLIMNGCPNPGDHYQTKFHPVTFDDRVQFPSHVKRFEVKMFTFFKDNVPARDQIFVHCEAVICDVYQTDPACHKNCALPGAGNRKRVRRSMDHDQLYRMRVTSGKILLNTPLIRMK